MEESIIKGWRNFWITKEEQHYLSQEPMVPEEIWRHKKLSLLGLVVADKLVNKEAFRNTMIGIWRLKGKVDFKEVGNNLFIFKFQENLDIQKVQKGQL